MTAERNTECRYLLAFMAPLSNRNFGDVIEKFEELLEGGRGGGGDRAKEGNYHW